MTSECYYCGAMFCHSAKKAGDHMPIPERNGGTDIVPCCSACHDMKDRIPLSKWHAVAWVEIEAQWHLYGRYTRLFLAKTLAVMSDSIAKTEAENKNKKVKP
jgi:hypothetical protein